MNRFRRAVLASALVAGAMLATGPAAWAAKNYDAGATDTQITLGMPMPLSGPVSAYSVVGKVAQAYFKMINEHGGINGRQVNLLIYDDQYSPPKTVEVARRMVEQDKILAMFGNLGTAPNLAIQRYMNIKKIPQLYVQSGASQFNNHKQYPFTAPFLPSYQGEGMAFAQKILQTRPDARIAVLMQNDDMGREVLKGLRNGLGDKADKMIVATATYETADPTVDSQIVHLRSSGADVLVNVSTARFAAQAIRKVYDLGWKPDHYLNLAAASAKLTFYPAGPEKAEGVMTFGVVKEPGTTTWKDDPEVQEYEAMLQKYGADVDPTVSAGVMGYVVAQIMTHVIEQAGDELTHDKIRELGTNLSGFRPKMLLPGVEIRNSPDDLHVFATAQPVRFNGKETEPVGEILKLK